MSTDIDTPNPQSFEALMQATRQAADKAAKEQAAQEAAEAKARAAEMAEMMAAASQPDPAQQAINKAHDEAMAIINAAIAAGKAAREAMPARRQAAFEAAMAYGNAITAQITTTYADVEVQSWTAQEAEARTVLAGGTLADDAMLPHLAADRGVDLAAYAQSVIDKAVAYRRIAVAAVRLRRGAEGLLSEAIDTPEKLAEAVEALRQQTAAAAADLGLAA